MLKTIVETTRRHVAELAPRRGALEAAAARAPRPPEWSRAFAVPEVAVIAEVKRRSPSAGSIAPNLDPGDHARRYVAGGARAISVLTDAPYFGGSLDDLAAVRASVPVPVLRKDFILDPIQVYESRAAGASAILLIVRVLDRGLLRELAALAADLGLGRLVEVHAPAELDAALAVDPEAIGVNSRDLDTLAIDQEPLAQMLAMVPAGTIAVAESGLAHRADVERVAAMGADAILVGTALAGAAAPERAVADLVGVPRSNGRARFTGGSKEDRQ